MAKVKNRYIIFITLTKSVVYVIIALNSLERELNDQNNNNDDANDDVHA